MSAFISGVPQGLVFRFLQIPACYIGMCTGYLPGVVLETSPTCFGSVIVPNLKRPLMMTVVLWSRPGSICVKYWHRRCYGDRVDRTAAATTVSTKVLPQTGSDCSPDVPTLTGLDRFVVAQQFLQLADGRVHAGFHRA